jgi:8-oxo-dGTP diphosphatase
VNHGPLAAEPGGNLLLAWTPGRESDLDVRDPSVPLPLALVVVVADGKVLLVHNRWRQEWELPGGMIDDGETARQAAGRELMEEAGLVAADLDYAGLARFRLEPDKRQEYAAVYRTEHAGALEGFEVNEEVDEIMWWNPAEDVPGLCAIDAWLARAAR